MTDWPTTLTDQKLIKYDQVDRTGGYDFTLEMVISFANGAATQMAIAGEVDHNKSGMRYTGTFTIKGMPPTQAPSAIPRSITVEIEYGDEVGDLVSCEVSQTTKFIDDHSETTRSVELLPSNLRDFSGQETVDALGKVFGGQTFNEVWRGERDLTLTERASGRDDDTQGGGEDRNGI